MTKTGLPELEIQKLGANHDRAGFDCGIEPLNTFLKTQARQQAVRHLGQTFVAVTKAEPKRILGFYTLAAGSIRFEELSDKETKRLPKYPIPVCRLGRLAIDQSIQGRGLGALLLGHACQKAVQAAEAMGIAGVVVDAKDEKAKSFYEKHGFISFRDSPMKLWLPMTTIIQSLVER
ncbi:GNAT family N-acetyltransferase [Bdellovibrionota bacterium FG-1]